MKAKRKTEPSASEEISRANWARDFVYSKTLLNLLLRSVPKSKIEATIYEYLGEFPPSLGTAKLFPLGGNHRFIFNPIAKSIKTLKIAFWVAAFLEINGEINRMPKILEKIAERENRDHFLLQRLKAQRYRLVQDHYSFENGTLNAPAVKVFKNVLLSGSGILIDSKKSVYLSDPAADPRSTFIAGLWNHFSFSRVHNQITFHGTLQSGTIAGDFLEGIDLTGRCSSNYWHSLIEYAPRLLNVELKSSVPAFISSEMPKSVRDALLLINPKLRLIDISESHWVRVGTLHVPKFNSRTLDSGQIYASEMFECDEKIIKEFSNKVLKEVKPNANVPSRIYLRRSSKFRTPVGTEEFEQILEEHGFVFINPQELSFSEQVQLFQSAKTIITFGGAAWANLIFGNPLTRFISITTEASAPFDMHAQIAKLFGLDYRQVVSKSPVELDEPSPYYRFYCHHSVKVNSDMLDEIRELIS